MLQMLSTSNPYISPLFDFMKKFVQQKKQFSKTKILYKGIESTLRG